jgi:hypothetical protein
MELDDAARRVDEVRVALRDLAARLGSIRPPSAGLGAIAPGAFGELGRALASRTSGAVDARAAEARTLGDAASALSASVRAAMSGYREVDGHRGRGPRLGGA